MSKPIIIELPEAQARELFRVAEVQAHFLREPTERAFWTVVSQAVETGFYNKDKFHQCSSCFEPQEGQDGPT